MEGAHKRGKTPYFVVENSKYTGAQFAPKPKATSIEPKTRTSALPGSPIQETPKQQSIQERAAARNATRSEEDIEKISNASSRHGISEKQGSKNTSV